MFSKNVSSLRKQIAVRYTLMLLGMCVFMVLLGYHEFIEESQLRASGQPMHWSWFIFGEYAETIYYIGMPLVWLAGWFWIRQGLLPIDEVTTAMDKLDARSLQSRLPRSGRNDEMDRLAEGFNRMAERLENAFHRIREFTMRTSHELKTPLSIMQGELEIALKDPGLKSELAETIRSELDEIARLRRIIDQLLFLLNADLREQQLKKETVSLSELVTELYEDATILAESNRIRVSLEESADLVIHGDRHRLRQLLLNLVDNAVKYNVPEGFVRLRITAEGKYAVIRVSNSGPGIAPAELAQVFETYFRDVNAISAGKEGFGLGLPIVKAIAEAHGGDVAIESGPEVTVVTVRLPVVRK